MNLNSQISPDTFERIIASGVIMRFSYLDRVNLFDKSASKLVPGSEGNIISIEMLSEDQLEVTCLFSYGTRAYLFDKQEDGTYVPSPLYNATIVTSNVSVVAVK